MKLVPHTTLVLVIPPQLGLLKGFSSGLISLANYVETHSSGVEVAIIDLSATPDEFLKETIRAELRKTKPTQRLIVGITATTASYQGALAAARAFKNIVPSAVVVFGGHHASADPENILYKHEGLVDFVIVGEGEKSLVELINKLSQAFSVPGLAFLHNGLFHRNAPAPFLTQTELDNLPITFHGNGLLDAPGKFDHVTYVSARGCPLACAFCSVANEKIRAKSVARVLKEIRELVEFGFTRIAIEDNFFAHSPGRTRELCGALAALRREGLAFSWDCQTRVESMARPEVLPIMVDAGCEAVYLGVESLVPEHLLYLGKTPQPEKYLHQFFNVVVPKLLCSPIDCHVNLQFALPGENDRHYERTAHALRMIGSMAISRGKTVTIFPQLFVVYPGTKHFSQGILGGRFSKDVFETFTAWESSQAPILTWLGEHFAHGTGGLPEGLVDAEKLRQGVYEVNVNAVFRVSATLKALDRIPGIKMFQYGSYLVEKRSRHNETKTSRAVSA